MQEDVVVVDGFEAALERDHFLDELEPVVQNGTIVGVCKGLSDGAYFLRNRKELV